MGVPEQLLEVIDRRIARAMKRTTAFATVTTAFPLTVTFPGDTAAVPVSAASTFAGSVGDTALLMKVGTRFVATGVLTGGGSGGFLAASTFAPVSGSPTLISYVSRWSAWEFAAGADSRVGQTLAGGGSEVSRPVTLWWAATSTATAGTVAWNVLAYPADEAGTVATTAVSVNVTPNTDGQNVLVKTSLTLDLPASDVWSLVVRRLTSGTHTGAVGLLGVQL